MWELANVQDWASLEATDKQASNLLASMSIHMYTYHRVMIDATEQLQLLVTSNAIDPVIAAPITQLYQSLGYLMQWMLTTELYNYYTNPDTLENFSIRVAVDLLNQHNATLELFGTLNQTTMHIVQNIVLPLEMYLRQPHMMNSSAALLGLLGPLKQTPQLLSVAMMEYLTLARQFTPANPLVRYRQPLVSEEGFFR